MEDHEQSKTMPAQPRRVIYQEIETAQEWTNDFRLFQRESKHVKASQDGNLLGSDGHSKEHQLHNKTNVDLQLTQIIDTSDNLVVEQIDDDLSDEKDLSINLEKTTQRE